ERDHERDGVDREEERLRDAAGNEAVEPGHETRRLLGDVEEEDDGKRKRESAKREEGRRPPRRAAHQRSGLFPTDSRRGAGQASSRQGRVAARTSSKSRSSIAPGGPPSSRERRPARAS